MNTDPRIRLPREQKTVIDAATQDKPEGNATWARDPVGDSEREIGYGEGGRIERGRGRTESAPERLGFDFDIASISGTT